MLTAVPVQAEQEMAIIRWSAVQSKDAFEVGEVIGKSNFDVREAKLTGFGVKCDVRVRERCRSCCTTLITLRSLR